MGQSEAKPFTKTRFFQTPSQPLDKYRGLGVPPSKQDEPEAQAGGLGVSPSKQDEPEAQAGGLGVSPSKQDEPEAQATMRGVPPSKIISQDTRSTELGPAWRHSYLASITPIEGSHDLMVNEPDGRQHRFVYQQARNYQAPCGIDETLTGDWTTGFALTRHNKPHQRGDKS